MILGKFSGQQRSTNKTSNKSSFQHPNEVAFLGKTKISRYIWWSNTQEKKGEERTETKSHEDDLVEKGGFEVKKS